MISLYHKLSNFVKGFFEIFFEKLFCTIFIGLALEQGLILQSVVNEPLKDANLPLLTDAFNLNLPLRKVEYYS